MLSTPTFTNRWNPFQELATLHRDMDRVFGRQYGGEAGAETNGAGAWNPPCEIAAVDDGWRVRLALPGVDPSAVQITLNGNSLQVSGERRRVAGDKLTHSEMSYGPFERTFTLPAPADGERVEARYDHGMLTVTVPVAESAKPRKIRVADADVKTIESRKTA